MRGEGEISGGGRSRGGKGGIKAVGDYGRRCQWVN